MKEFDMICVIVILVGEGGVVIVRILGEKVLDIVGKIFLVKNK